MTPEEQRLVEQLFADLKQHSGAVEDNEADTLIRRTLAQQPELAYRLVQHAILQDVALQEAQRRIAALQPRPGNSGGSFLGRMFGAGSTTPPPQPQRPSPSNWGAGAASAPTPSTGGGFLRSAASTAMGVAAGSLLFNGLEHLFGGAGAGGFAGRPEEIVENNTVINDYADQQGGNPGGWLGGGTNDSLADSGDLTDSGNLGGWGNDPTGMDDSFGGDSGDSGDSSGWDGDGLDLGGGLDDGYWS